MVLNGFPNRLEFYEGRVTMRDDSDILFAGRNGRKIRCVDVLGKGLVFSARQHVPSAHPLSFSMIDFVYRCSHAGIVNVVKDAVATFKRPVHMVRTIYYPFSHKHQALVN